MAARKPYSGSRRRLILAFDVGTTYSGISYSILDPGQLPSIRTVTRFPAQEQISGASKIPTIIYYDQSGEARAIGAEATRDGIFEAAEDGGWSKAEWFKLHLRSKVGEGETISDHVPPLPPNKTVVDVFADYLAYLLKCSASYIEDTHPNGSHLWKEIQEDIYYVLSHPNGWEGKEQNQMRRAAVKAGLIADTQRGHLRLSFVTEGEASLHFAIENGVLSHTQGGEGIVIVDAGGGTVDISSYRRRDSHSGKRQFEEIAVAQCHFFGSVFVTIRAMEHLEDYLKESEFINDLDHIVRCFDKTTKTRFRSIEEPQYIKFGSTRDNDATCNIRFGQLKMDGQEVAKFFQPSIDCIVQSVSNTQRTALNEVKHVVLVGGFSASDHLFQKVKDALQAKHLNVVRPEQHVNKAVSDGAISFYLDHHVRSRVIKFTYGKFSHVTFRQDNPEHLSRIDQVFISKSGVQKLRGRFWTIVPKNTKVSENKEYRLDFVQRAWKLEEFKRLTTNIVCYRGAAKEPQWVDLEPDSFTTVCTLISDLSELPPNRKVNPEGREYFEADFDVILKFGLTEFQAQLAWKINGEERRGPAKVIYEDN